MPGEGWRWVGWRRHPNPRAAQTPPLRGAPSLLALRPQSRSGVPQEPPGTGVSEGGGGGRRPPHSVLLLHGQTTGLGLLPGRLLAALGLTAAPCRLSSQDSRMLRPPAGRAVSSCSFLPPTPGGGTATTLVCWTQGYWPWWGDCRIPSSCPLSPA